MNDPFRALVFDSTYNQYKGIIAHMRVEDGDHIPPATACG